MSNPEDDELRPEYDVSKLKLIGRGLYHDSYWRMKGGRILSPDLVDFFRDDDAVNNALRDYLRQKRQPA